MENLIIVGYGYMGLRVAKQLSTQEHPNIYCLSRQSKPVQQNHHNVLFDLDDKQALTFPISSSVLSNAHILYLVPPPKSGQTNPRIKHFLQLLDKQTALPKKLVLISTTGVYGDCQGEWINEQQPLNPQEDRAKRRVDAEQQLISFCQKHQIDYVILRVAGIYAEDKLPINRLKQQKPLLAQKDSPFSNRIHADDLCEIFIQALSSDVCGIYHCADGHPSTMYEYFSGIASALDLPQPPIISKQQVDQELSAGMASYMNESRRIDNRKLLNDFGLKLKYPSFEDFLQSLPIKNSNHSH